MNARWQALAARFAALQQREKVLVAAAVVLVAGFGSYLLWVEPAAVKAANLKKQIDQRKGDLNQLQAQVDTLRAGMRDPDAATKSALAEAKAALAATEQRLRAFDGTLVAPERVPQLLQSLLARHRGLALVSLETLAPTPLIALAAGDKEAKSGQAALPTGSNIFKHGLEIKVAGGYHDLLAYVAELERSPQKLLWGGMELKVTAYPKSELTLTVYTLSLDSIWLVV